MANHIPTKSRAQLKARDKQFCFRCGMRGNHWHHRRGKRVTDEHTHHPCNGITLCPTCHEWVHKNPFESRRYGWIVSRAEANPGSQPVFSRVVGWVLLTCDATYLDAPTHLIPEET